MRHPFLPANDFRKDLPGVISVSAMVILCASLFNTACDLGNQKISVPHYIIGTAENNNGCYPVAESVMAAVMIGLVVLQMAANEIAAAVVHCRKTAVSAPLIQAEFNLKPIAGVHYYGLTNMACLHLPRLLLVSSVLALMAVLPWINVAMDWGVRMQYEDPDQGEAVAGEYGRKLLRLLPMFEFFAACLLPVIKNLNYIRSESEASVPKASVLARLLSATDHLFIDHSKTYTRSSAGLQ